MLKRYVRKAEALLWSLVYDYQCVAEWSAERSYIIKTRINKWTKHRTVVDTTVITTARFSSQK